MEPDRFEPSICNPTNGALDFVKLLNRFISAKTYRAVAKPNRQTDGEAKPRLRRINQTPYVPNGTNIKRLAAKGQPETVIEWH